MEGGSVFPAGYNCGSWAPDHTCGPRVGQARGLTLGREEASWCETRKQLEGLGRGWPALHFPESQDCSLPPSETAGRTMAPVLTQFCGAAIMRRRGTGAGACQVPPIRNQDPGVGGHTEGLGSVPFQGSLLTGPLSSEQQL